MEFTRRTFSIDTCLGRGGFGEVYLAEMTSSTGLSTSVALKVLRRDVAPGGQAVQRLKDEARALAALNHPAILGVHDLVFLEGRVALITEYVDGEDLEKCLRGDDRIGSRAVLEVLSQVAGALHAAYTAPIGEGGAPLKLIHRDVKPSNIRIGRHGEVKLLDFGIARTDEVAREARTQTNMMVGSPPYMAPERFLEATPRPASDVFSLGCVLLEALIGQRVFDLPVTMLAGLAVDPTRYQGHLAAQLRAVPETAPPEVVALATEMLRRTPDDRPNAAEVSKRLDALVDRLDGVTLARFCRDRRWRDPPREPGDLLGKVMTEGSIERFTTDGYLDDPPPAAPPAAVPVRRPRQRGGALVWLGGAGVLATSVGAVALAVVGAAAFGVWWSQPPPDALPVVVPVLAPSPVRQPAPVVVPGPVVPGPVVPGPVVPAPVVPGPIAKPRPAPVVQPRPPDPLPELVEPAPPPAPAAVGPKPSTVMVLLDGDASKVSLFGGGSDIHLPARVVPGTYDLVAQFPDNQSAMVRITIEPGADRVISCVARFLRCSLKS